MTNIVSQVDFQNKSVFEILLFIFWMQSWFIEKKNKQTKNQEILSTIKLIATYDTISSTFPSFARNNNPYKKMGYEYADNV